MIVRSGDVHASLSTASKPRGVASGRQGVMFAVLLVLAALALVVGVLPVAWKAAAGPSQQAGREFAARWMQSQPAAASLTKYDVDMLCIAEADRAAVQGTQLDDDDDGRQLPAGRIIRVEFRNACIAEALHHLSPHP